MGELSTLPNISSNLEMQLTDISRAFVGTILMTVERNP